MKNVNEKRKYHEMVVLGQVIDLLIADVGMKKARQMDAVEILMRRLIKVEQADEDGSWQLASKMYEVDGDNGAGTARELREARKAVRFEREFLGKASGKPGASKK